MCEFFGLGCRIWNVSACRDVEIVQLEPILEHVAVICRESSPTRRTHGRPAWRREASADDRHPMIALLAIDSLMDVTQLLKPLRRKQVVYHLGLLQAQHIGRMRL